jgi:hypothetical protein
VASIEFGEAALSLSGACTIKLFTTVICFFEVVIQRDTDSRYSCSQRLESDRSGWKSSRVAYNATLLIYFCKKVYSTGLRPQSFVGSVL